MLQVGKLLCSTEEEKKTSTDNHSDKVIPREGKMTYKSFKKNKNYSIFYQRHFSLPPDPPH